MVRIISFFLSMLEAVISGVIGAGFDGLSSLLFRSRKKEYSASFGRVEDQLRKDGNGFRVGFKYGCTLLESHTHIAVFGGSGSKKSSCLIYPTILQCNDCSMVVFDCNRELSRTAAYKREQGYDVYFFDLDDCHRSIGFNWLPLCASEADVSRCMQVFYKNVQGDAPYDFWVQSAENLSSFFAYLLVSYAEPEYVNMANVLHMITVFSYAPEKIDRWVVATGNERLISRYKALLSTPEKTMQSTISTATNALAIFNSPDIAAITSKNTLPFQLFREKKCILYICGSPATIQYTRCISASFFDSFFAHLLRRLPDPAKDNSIMFLLDEAATMRLEMLPKCLELGRKFLLSICTLWQDYAQIEHLYGKQQASNIYANSRMRAFMPSGMPLATCKMLSETLGFYSYTDDKGIARKRELLTPQEVFTLKDVLLLNGNASPLLLRPRPYFMSERLKRLTELPPYENADMEPLSPPPLLPFA